MMQRARKRWSFALRLNRHSVDGVAMAGLHVLKFEHAAQLLTGDRQS